MHLGPDRTAAFIRHVLDAGSYVVCHDTLTYGVGVQAHVQSQVRANVQRFWRVGW